MHEKTPMGDKSVINHCKKLTSIKCTFKIYEFVEKSVGITIFQYCAHDDKMKGGQNCVYMEIFELRWYFFSEANQYSGLGLSEGKFQNIKIFFTTIYEIF
jgi:hypothetical protein